MGWRPGKDGGWSKFRERAEARLQQVLRTVLMVVPGGSIRAGKTWYDDDETVGFWMGIDLDETAKFNLGGGGKYLRWTGTTLEISGSLRTKNDYVRVIDESSEPYGEGVTLLQDAWLASGALRWLDASGSVGALLVSNNNGQAGSTALLHVYPRAEGGSASLQMQAHSRPFGEVGDEPVGFSLFGSGAIVTGAGLEAGGAQDRVQVVVWAAPGAQSADIVQVMDANEAAAVVVTSLGRLEARQGLESGNVRADAGGLSILQGSGIGSRLWWRDAGDQSVGTVHAVAGSGLTMTVAVKRAGSGTSTLDLTAEGDGSGTVILRVQAGATGTASSRVHVLVGGSTRLTISNTGNVQARGGFDAFSQRVTGVADATADTDALNRRVGDGRYVAKAGGWSGSFKDADGYTFTVNNGQITARS